MKKRKKSKKVYILPTGYGLMYGAGILASLIGGVVYSNNLAFMLCFFLMALFLIGMVQTHNNLKKIHIEKFAVFLSPSEGIGHGVIWLKNEGSEKCNQIRLQCKDNDDSFDVGIDTIFSKSLCPQYFDFKTGKWGKKKVRKIKLSTRYPFGFFYVWRNFRLPTEYFIYPKPGGSLGFPFDNQRGMDERSRGNKEGDDFSEHRRHETGESHKHIDWKAYARGRSLLTKKFNEGGRHTCVIDYDQTMGDEDQRMRQLSQWVHQCEDKRMVYSVKLKTKEMPPGYGDIHKSTCLKLLASCREVS